MQPPATSQRPRASHPLVPGVPPTRPHEGPQRLNPEDTLPPQEQPPLDFDSDEPLPVCPMRNNGDDICESCQ